MDDDGSPVEGKCCSGAWNVGLGVCASQKPRRAVSSRDRCEKKAGKYALRCIGVHGNVLSYPCTLRPVADERARIVDYCFVRRHLEGEPRVKWMFNTVLEAMQDFRRRIKASVNV